MQKLLLDCVDGIYIAKYGHLTLILTQDLEEAKRIGKQYTGQEVSPQWWIEPINLVRSNYICILDTFVQLENSLGCSVHEFCSQMGDCFTICGFSI